MARSGVSLRRFDSFLEKILNEPQLAITINVTDWYQRICLADPLSIQVNHETNFAVSCKQ